MTILTKPFNEKKSDKLDLPLVSEGQGSFSSPSAPLDSINGDVETRTRRMSSATTIFLFLSAIAVMCMGILGGVAIYRLYAPSQFERLRFHGFCGVPYDSHSIGNAAEMLQANNNDIRSYPSENLLSALIRTRDAEFSPFDRLDYPLDENFFREEFELDLSDDESYAKIAVPDFKDGRSGRFIHDFKENQTGIIDSEKSRCFIMPLDRDTVLPPKSLYDLLTKMRSGYYNVDTDRIRKNMRVVLPELTDKTLVSTKIEHECVGMKMYLLEKYISGVFKRDVSKQLTNDGKFAEFSGKGIVEFDLVNIAEIDKLEKLSRK